MPHLLLNNFLDVITAFVSLLTATLLVLSHPLFFMSQLLVVMLFFIWNDNTKWLRRLLLLADWHVGSCVLSSLYVRLITCKWVYKVKTRTDGSVERYKARLVTRDFQQEHGLNYDETFALVIHMTSVPTLFALTTIREWPISQLDVKNDFLNGELHEKVYM
jgi:hypothetical protein